MSNIANMSSKKSAKNKSTIKPTGAYTSKLPKCRDLVYLDNNATTIICKDARDVMMAWQECYNPSSDSKISKSARAIMIKAKEYILRHCGLTEESHYALFTSGATESNCTILRATIDAYRKMRGVIPHIITSAVEHHSILECLHIMKDNDLVEYTLVQPTPEGSIKPRLVEAAIQPNTCLITIIYANNELGTINNVKAIGEIAHKHSIPMHTDAVQLFGKTRIFMDSINVDAMSVSFHKLYGPKGIGLLLVSKKLIEGYQIHAIIAGSQQNGLRGGTENVPSIAASLTALQWVFKNREKKNKHLKAMRTYVIDALSKEWNRVPYLDFITVCNIKEPFKSILYTDNLNNTKQEKKTKVDIVSDIGVVNGGTLGSNISDTLNTQHQQFEQEQNREQKQDIDTDEAEEEMPVGATHQGSLRGTPVRPKPIFVILGPHESELTRYLPNTILIAIVNPQELPAYSTRIGIEQFCNVKLKKALDKANVVVSIASACLTASDKASHVLTAIGAPSFIKRGVIRISFGDQNTMEQVKDFVEKLKQAVYKQI